MNKHIRIYKCTMKKLNYIKTLLVYSVILIVVFYLLPLLFKGGAASLLIINPLTVLFCSIICSKNSKIGFFIVLITILLFFPTIFIFYNESAWIYIVLYAIISIIGSYIGSIRNR